jgi:transposase InsO family protein
MQESVAMLCKIAQVSKSGYYKWRQTDKHKDEPDYLLIKQVFEKGRKKFGWRQVQMHLKADYQVIMNHKKIRRIMNKYGLVAQVRKRNPYKMIMKKTQEHRTCDNILNREFEQLIPRRVFCTDITYLYFGAGRRAYLSVIKDIATGEIVAWELSLNLELEFVLKTIEKLNAQELDSQALIHSDQGFHYTSPLYIQRVRQLNLTQSMSRKGNCVDNAPIESFFGHLKDELDLNNCSMFEELTEILNNYMNYYNNQRYQWELKKMTPVQYRNHLLSLA